MKNLKWNVFIRQQFIRFNSLRMQFIHFGLLNFIRFRQQLGGELNNGSNLYLFIEHEQLEGIKRNFWLCHGQKIWVEIWNDVNWIEEFRAFVIQNVELLFVGAYNQQLLIDYWKCLLCFGFESG